jgi:hypothetical protein
MQFGIIFMPKYLAYVKFLCYFFFVFVLSENVAFYVSKHLLAAER